MIKFVPKKERNFSQIIQLLTGFIHEQVEFFDKQENMIKGIFFAFLFDSNMISGRIDLDIILEKSHSDDFHVYMKVSEVLDDYEEFLSGRDWSQVNGLWINNGFNCEQELFDWLCGDIIIADGQVHLPKPTCSDCGRDEESELIYAGGNYGSKLDTFMGIPCYCRNCFESGVRQDYYDYKGGYFVFDLKGKRLPLLESMYSSLQRLRLVKDVP